MTDKNIKNILEIPEVEKLFKIIGEDKIFLVGGCVRNALSHQIIKDIDFASTIIPDEIIKILNANNIKYLDIGKDHGQ